MNVRCPRCETLLEIPEEVRDYDTVPTECGACGHQFTLHLNRPTLKIRPNDDLAKSASDDLIIVSEAGDDVVESVVLTEEPSVAGRTIESRFGPISSLTPLPAIGEEQDAAFLSAMARAQRDLREHAHGLGADGVVELKVDSVGSEDAPALRIAGIAVRFAREE